MTERAIWRTATPQSAQVPGVESARQQGIADEGLKGRDVVVAVLFVPSTFKTFEDSKVWCTPSSYTASGPKGRIGAGTVKEDGLVRGGGSMQKI